MSGLHTNFRSPTSAPPVEHVKRCGWRDQGIAVIDVTDPRLTWPERELLRQIADRLFGPRVVGPPGC